MTDHTVPEIRRRTVKVAGWAYFLIILSSILSLVLLTGKFTVIGDSVASVAGMAENSLLVRINIVYEVFMFSTVIILAVSLYEILKPVNRLLARSALLLRTAEAILGYLTIVCTLAVLLILKEHAGADNIDPLAVFFYDLRDVVYKILMICISLGTILFCILFYKGEYIPRLFPVWGITGFSLMILAGVLQLLAIEAGNTVNMVAAAIVIPFELIIGLWLIVKGIKMEEVQ